MSNLTQQELNSIREVVTAHQNVASKLDSYAQNVNDPAIRQMFDKGAQDARKNAMDLINLIG
ncbi:MAG: hypothetical protein FWE24_09530 [Defluviitaleaceae bacterium]|nr:hypothetical protein [Defluviitaleaceae bacterium]